MPFITEVDKWVLLYLVGFFFLFFRMGKHGRIAAAVLIITILFTDQFNSFVLKEWVGRLRPCHVLDGVRLLVDCGGGKSFPSSHAANNFAAAIVLSRFFPRSKWWFYIIAAMVAYSRVYIGVHYPFDILGGACVGLIIGFILSSAGLFIEKKSFTKTIKN